MAVQDRNDYTNTEITREELAARLDKKRADDAAKVLEKDAKVMELLNK